MATRARRIVLHTDRGVWAPHKTDLFVERHGFHVARPGVQVDALEAGFIGVIDGGMQYRLAVFFSVAVWVAVEMGYVGVLSLSGFSFEGGEADGAVPVLGDKGAEQVALADPAFRMLGRDLSIVGSRPCNAGLGFEPGDFCRIVGTPVRYQVAGWVHYDLL
jgi:hypothetical protein